MIENNEKLGFFKLYFKNFKSMLIGNLIFSIPFIIASALIYGVAFLTNLTTNLWFIGIIIVLIYPFFSGVTQITKDIVRDEKGSINPVDSYKKGLKNNFKFFAFYGVLMYLSVIISYYSIVLYFNLAMKSWVFYIPLFIAVLIALFLLFMSFSIPILTVTLDLKLKHYFKNAALMAFGELPMNFYVAVTTMVLISACLTTSLMTGNVVVGISVLIACLLLILPTGISYCAVYRLYPKIDRLFDIESKKEKSSFPTMPVAVSMDEDGNFIGNDSSDNDEGYVFVNGMMIKKSKAPISEYIEESD